MFRDFHRAASLGVNILPHPRRFLNFKLFQTMSMALWNNSFLIFSQLSGIIVFTKSLMSYSFFATLTWEVVGVFIPTQKWLRKIFFCSRHYRSLIDTSILINEVFTPCKNRLGESSTQQGFCYTNGESELRSCITYHKIWFIIGPEVDIKNVHGQEKKLQQIFVSHAKLAIFLKQH